MDGTNTNDTTVDTMELIRKLKDAEPSKSATHPAIIWIGSVTCALVILALTWVIIMSIRDNAFSLESILSVLLAFFSIFISILFYFKAAETSSKFYDDSYRFMRDNSVTLGKIEERFGEQLSNIRDSMARSDVTIHDLTMQIKSTENKKDRLVEEYINKSDSKDIDEGFKEFKEQMESTIRQLESMKKRLHVLEKEKEDNLFGSATARIVKGSILPHQHFSLKSDGTIGISSSDTTPSLDEVMESFNKYKSSKNQK